MSAPKSAVFSKRIDYARNIFVVLMGKPGVGKTDAIRRMLEAGFKVAHLDTDGGARSILDLQDRPDFLHADCSSPDKLREGFRAISAEVGDDWLIYLDSFTDALVNDVSEREKEGKLRIQDWGDLAAMAGKILRVGKERKLARHFVMSVKEEYEQDAEGIRLWRPNLQGKATGKVFAGSIDAIWRLAVVPDPTKGVKGVKYVTYTTALPDAETKFRCPPDLRAAIPDVIESADIGKYLKLVADYKSAAASEKGGASS